MADQSPYPGGDSIEVEPDRGPMTGLPRWVKVSTIVVLTLVVLLVIVRLTGVDPAGHDPGGPGDHGLGDQAAAIAWS